MNAATTPPLFDLAEVTPDRKPRHRCAACGSRTVGAHWHYRAVALAGVRDRYCHAEHCPACWHKDAP